MNKKEINKMKKEFKLNSSVLNIKEIYNVYVKKDNNAIIFSDLNYFNMLDTEAQELYFTNFKKILGGALNTKLFELQFDSTKGSNEMQLLLNDMMKNEDKEVYKEYGSRIIGKIIENYTYDTDIVVTFIRGEYWQSANKRNSSEVDGEDDIVLSLPFIIGSINKVEPFKRTLIFNYEDMKFKPSSVIDTFINLNNPLDGFVFPCFDGGYADVNKVLYYNSKPKDLNYKFVEDVLNCVTKFTAKEEKECFNDIIKNVVGESVKSEVIEDIYSKLSYIKEVCEDEEEEPTISLNDMKNILKDADEKDIEMLDKAFEDSCGKDYKFSVDNILPDFNSKSLKVWNEDISITMSPKNLNAVKQVKDANGEKCLLIKLTDNVIVEGFKLALEE